MHRIGPVGGASYGIPECRDCMIVPGLLQIGDSECVVRVRAGTVDANGALQMIDGLAVLLVKKSDTTSAELLTGLKKQRFRREQACRTEVRGSGNEILTGLR